MITLSDYLAKHNILINEDTVVEYHLINDPDHEEYKDTMYFPGFTGEQISIDEQDRLVINTEFDDGGTNNIKIPLSHKGEDNDGFVTELIGESVKLVFLS
jgi:hypothetical protein